MRAVEGLRGGNCACGLGGNRRPAAEGADLPGDQGRTLARTPGGSVGARPLSLSLCGCLSHRKPAFLWSAALTSQPPGPALWRRHLGGRGRRPGAPEHFRVAAFRCSGNGSWACWRTRGSEFFFVKEAGSTAYPHQAWRYPGHHRDLASSVVFPLASADLAPADAREPQPGSQAHVGSVAAETEHMCKGRGRTGRIRRRKLFRRSESRGVNESCKSEFIELKKWLKDRAFEDRNLIPARFPGTGRGLMSKISLREGQMIISLPESCLLTTDTVIRSYLGTYISKWKPSPSPLLALCTFLVSEKHAGDRSLWKPYLEILPETYTCPVCLEPEVVDLLPRPLRAKAEEQRAHVQELFASSRGFFSSLQPLFVEAVDSIFSPSALLWAWCTVNTRAVYLRPKRQACLSAEPDTCALAPYLDLLNHSPHVQVKAAFNEKTRCYEIRTASNFRKHEEVFICYGPHDNQRLLLEYGFVSPHNPHACVYVSREMLVKYLPSSDKQVDKKISILKDHDFLENLTFGWDGPSWRLLTALKLLCLEAEKFICWKKILLGEVVSDINEKASLGVAQKICCYFIEETSAMLQKVSHMKDEKVSLLNQLALVESLWMEELKILKASAEILNSLQTPLTDLT